MSDQAKKQALIRELIDYNTKFPGPVVREHYLKNGGSYKYRSCFKTFNAYIKAAFADDAELSLPTDEQTGTETQQDITDDKWVITLPKTTINNYDQLKAEFKIDESIWAVKRFNATYDERNEMYRVVAFLTKKTNVIAARQEIEALKELAKQNAHVPFDIVRKDDGKEGHLLEITIADQHFGKLAWSKETGHEPYDIGIAKAMFNRALDSLIERTQGYKFSSVLFVVGNDLFQSDNALGTTTRGTKVDTDGRYQKTFSVVRNTIVESIEKLRKIAPVKVVLCSGNHDQLAVFHLGDSLECYFAKYQDVEVENSPRARKYHRFGNVLLMFAHGHEGKREDYPLLMATEAPRLFGETKFREVHTGHIHQTKTQEFNGVRVRVLPSLSPADAWHSSNGYVNNLRTAEAYVWSEREGLLAIHYYNDDAQPPLRTEYKVVEG